MTRTVTAKRLDLVDIIDDLSETRDFVNVALMATSDIGDRFVQSSLSRILDLVSDQLSAIDDKLNAAHEAGMQQ